MNASAPPAPEPLDVRWIHGSASAKHNTDPDIQVFEYDERTFVLRQNKAVHYEAPFLFLLFGDDRAVLLDTGATPEEEFFPLREVVDELFELRPPALQRPGYELLVLHTHAHGDHVAGDAQFAGRPDTVVVPADRDSAWDFLGFTQDPDRVALLDLGGGSWNASPRPATTPRPSPTTTRRRASCSPATPSTRAGCTSRTGPPSGAPSTGWSPSPGSARSPTCWAATSR